MRQVAGFDPEMKDRIAECDGGGAIAGTRYAGRQEFIGRLTGEYVDHGDPPWRWFLLTDLIKKPDNYPDDAVWCERGNLWLMEQGTGNKEPGTENVPEATSSMFDVPGSGGRGQEPGA